MAMRINQVDLYHQHQPFVEGTYTCSGGRSAHGFDSTIVRITTRDGTQGWGEMAPLGSFYDAAFVDGARAGLQELAPQLLGYDCRNCSVINERMDLLLKGMHTPNLHLTWPAGIPPVSNQKHRCTKH